jgi:hypothetical protein
MTPAIKSAFPKISPRVDPKAQTKLNPSTAVAAAPQTPLQNTTNGAGNASAKPRTHAHTQLGEPINPTDEIVVPTEFWLEIVSRVEKAAPFWGYLGDPRSADFGRRCVACLNAAHWPTAAALERKDWRAIKWFIAVSLCERVSLETHPLVSAIRFRLAQMALARPVVPSLGNGPVECICAQR